MRILVKGFKVNMKFNSIQLEYEGLTTVDSRRYKIKFKNFVFVYGILEKISYLI